MKNSEATLVLLRRFFIGGSVGSVRCVYHMDLDSSVARENPRLTRENLTKFEELGCSNVSGAAYNDDGASSMTSSDDYNICSDVDSRDSYVSGTMKEQSTLLPAPSIHKKTIKSI